MTTSDGSIMRWKEKLINIVMIELGNNLGSLEISRIGPFDKRDIGIHLAIFTEPFLSLLIEGKKTVESRFSVNRISPFGKIEKGDVIVVKKNGGPVVGFFIAGDVKYYSNLDKHKINEIERMYSDSICAKYDPEFWVNRYKSNYVTLVDVEEFRKTKPYRINKRDRSGWVVVKNRAESTII